MLKAKAIANRIASIQATKQITKALKVIAINRLGQTKKKISTFIPYMYQFSRLLNRIAFGSKQESKQSVFLKKRRVKKVLLIPFSTHQSFCGGLNKQVSQETYRVYREGIVSNKRVDLLPIGKKATLFFKKENIPYIDRYLYLNKNIDLAQVNALGTYLLKSYKKGIYDQVSLIYPTNVNALQQEICIQELLPIVPVQGESEIKSAVDFIYEPSKDAIMDSLLPKFVTLELYEVFLKASEAEYTARSNAMTKASDNADTLLKELRIAHNRTRQSGITRQIIQIAASCEALKST